MHQRSKIVTLLGLTLLIIFFGIRLVHYSPKPTKSGKMIEIVAAENFWGSLASQIGGDRVHVFSIISDPNADPHEYESNSTDARAIATANLVILNGVGYDSWVNQLLNASTNTNRSVLTIGNLVDKKAGDNPHLWYDPVYVSRAVIQIDHNLIAIDPSGKSYYEAQLTKLQSSLNTYQDRIKSIKKQFNGDKVAATEDIFTYLAGASGLDLISPASFTEAVAEGNDPPASSIVEFQQQLESGHVKLLVYNKQTVTPLTNSIKILAANHHIPIVGVTETIEPPNTSFQIWMNAELQQLQMALNTNL
jgi:zinc/manganese transport system substrate-binding protein